MRKLIADVLSKTPQLRTNKQTNNSVLQTITIQLGIFFFLLDGEVCFQAILKTIRRPLV